MSTEVKDATAQLRDVIAIRDAIERLRQIDIHDETAPYVMALLNGYEEERSKTEGALLSVERMTVEVDEAHRKGQEIQARLNSAREALKRVLKAHSTNAPKGHDINDCVICTPASAALRYGEQAAVPKRQWARIRQGVYEFRGPHPHRRVQKAEGGKWDLYLEDRSGMQMRLFELGFETKALAQERAEGLTLADRL